MLRARGAVSTRPRRPCLLLFPLRGQEPHQKQVGIGYRGYSQKIYLAWRSTLELHLAMPVKESYVRARVDTRLKRDSELILHELGLTTTDAIRIFLHQVILHKGLPFDLRLKEDNSDVLLPVAIRQSALDAVYDD